jgi:hypothetical protein
MTYFFRTKTIKGDPQMAKTKKASYISAKQLDLGDVVFVRMPIPESTKDEDVFLPAVIVGGDNANACIRLLSPIDLFVPVKSLYRQS